MAYRIVSYVLGLLRWVERRVIARPAKTVLNRPVADHMEIVADLVNLPAVKYTRRVMQHLYHSRFDHMMLASKFAYYFARTVNANVHTCVRAAAIHDVWTKDSYVQPAVDFAKSIGESPRVQAAIASHMVFNKVPRTKEQWVVAFADECAWGVEALEFLRHGLRNILGWLAHVSPVNLK
jgi:glycyl-tRNA synthetase beta chain/uncharacterized protein